MNNDQGSSYESLEGTRPIGPPADPSEDPTIDVAILEIPIEATVRSETRTLADGHSSQRSRRMLRGLVRELIQAETCTSIVCQREAERLGTSLPAAVLRGAALHASQALRSLRQHAPDQPTLLVGTLSGSALSLLRVAFLDYVQTAEQTYRSALQNLRCSVDLVASLGRLAIREGEVGLIAWCEEWLSLRVPIVNDAEASLAWFTENIEAATTVPRPRLTRALTKRHDQPSARAA